MNREVGRAVLCAPGHLARQRRNVQQTPSYLTPWDLSSLARRPPPPLVEPGPPATLAPPWRPRSRDFRLWREPELLCVPRPTSRTGPRRWPFRSSPLIWAVRPMREHQHPFPVLLLRQARGGRKTVTRGWPGVRALRRFTVILPGSHLCKGYFAGQTREKTF